MEECHAKNHNCRHYFETIFQIIPQKLERDGKTEIKFENNMAEFQMQNTKKFDAVLIKVATVNRIFAVGIFGAVGVLVQFYAAARIPWNLTQIGTKYSILWCLYKLSRFFCQSVLITLINFSFF